MSDPNFVHKLDQPLSEEWLKAAGFKWHEFERQGSHHWLLWLGAVVGKHASSEDLGIEVAQCFRDDPEWHCWLRADYAGRYSRFIHLRHIRTAREVVNVIFGVTGCEWNPDNCWYGSMVTQEKAEYYRREYDRLDRRIMRDRTWNDAEKDDTIGRPQIEHRNVAEKARTGSGG